MQIWGKTLSNGDIALGIFNLGETVENYSFKYHDLGLANGKYTARDLWRQLDLGSSDTFTTRVASHGVTLIRIKRSK